MTSPGESFAATESMTVCVIAPEGTITQTTRGDGSAAMTSSTSAAAMAPASFAFATCAASRSIATTVWPPLSSRTTMLRPIFPRPIIAMCIGRRG